MSGPVARQLFEWIEQNFPDGDVEDRLQRALAEVDNLANVTGESPDELKKMIRAALEHSAERVEFPGRLLGHGTEPVRDADLRVGAVYYQIGFHDSDLLIPYLMPYAFAGFGLSGEGDDLAYFQDVDSFSEGVRFGDGHGDDEADFMRQSRPVSGMYTFDVALESLMRVALTRESIMKRSYREKLRLESGSVVEIKAHTYVGREMYELNYFTHIPLDDGPSLRAEMLEVWKHHSTTEDIGNPKFRAVTANHKLEFVDQALPRPVSIAFRREGDAWVEFDWRPWGEEE